MTNMQKKVGIGAVITVLLLLGFYFLYWIKTPVYSLNLVREAIQKHDVQTFEKHVDLDSVYNKVFDDTLLAQEKITGENITSNPFAFAILQAMKPGIVSIIKNETLSEIQNQEQTPAENKSKNSMQAKLATDLKAKSNFKNVEVKDVSTIDKNGDTAIVAIKLYNKKTDKDFDLKLKMTKLEDGSWKVKEITNWVDFFVNNNKAS